MNIIYNCEHYMASEQGEKLNELLLTFLSEIV
jgi:hypothetical protein